jgi:hypothetical protein
MADLIIRDDVVEDLHRIAEQENRSVEDVLRTMIDSYSATHAQRDPLDDFIGAFDDDVPDLSSNVRETMEDYYRKKYGNPR